MLKASINQALKRAKTLANNGETDRAITIYERNIQAAPDHRRAQAELEELRSNSAQPTPQVPNSSTDDTAIRELGSLIEAKAYEKAAPKATQLIQMYPTSAAIWNGYGAAQQGLGAIDEATRAFRKALALAPEDNRIKFNLARHHQKTGKLDEAIQLLQEILHTEPRWANVHVMLGI